MLGAYDDDRLIGIIRAVGDGQTIVFVQDIIVLPEYQRKGIGTKLLKAVMEKYKDVYQMELLTDNTEKTKAFYRSVGFTASDDRCKKQSGGKGIHDRKIFPEWCFAADHSRSA